MASPPLRVPLPHAPKRHCRGLGSAAVTSTPASTGEAAVGVVTPSPDAISEILTWLPTKSLCRFRCVSKEWRALVSSPAFVAARGSRAEPLLVARSTCGRTMQLMDTEGTVVRAVEAPDVAWIFRGSLGGLACFSSGGHNSGTLVMDLANGKTLLACLEPVAAPALMYYTGYGFGRAAQSGSLRVFRFVLHRPGEQMCEVLTLGYGAANTKWRRTRSPPMMVSLWYSRCSGVAANGALHFLSFRDDVLSFDLENEEWKVIRGPQGVVVGGEETISITELNDTLCMVHMVHRVIDIWLLSGSSKGMWSKAYTMPRDPVFFGSVVPLRMLRLGGGLLFYCYDYTLEPKLRVYDPCLGKCIEVKTPADLRGKIGFCSSYLDPRIWE